MGGDSKMKLLLLCALASLFISCRAKHIEPIKWQKPGDELVGEWVWEKGVHNIKGKNIETTDYGTFLGNPGLTASCSVVFQKDGSWRMIDEFPSRYDTTYADWNVYRDTLKVTFRKYKRTFISLYKVVGNKLFTDFLTDQKVHVEYSRY